ncbi:glycosyltransferase family 2 protein [Anaeromyxobacter diazotrophicus]|uniref:Glycosyl transferase n=1 Tax=Anaeromyxobacter diazotrophicus TaxID=2590199 RepID=A0A7I9VJ36_9BACT|nr:glycosyltransferase family 2 protein [Anaeromyxobacter diazotrophicus]GEJ56373.1 glycosyl transferase [Anaeromyxobacter diazotrophicus]
MPRPLRISVVTPSFNQAAFLPRTLQSVLGQQGEFELDYRVQDGGSRDGSVELLERHAGRLRFKTEPDHGQADAVNRALREADGDVVGWVNSDDLLLPGALDRVAKAFRERPGTQWVHGRCEIIDAEDRPIRRWLSAYKDRRCRRYSYRKLLLENFVSQMTVFWRRDALDAGPLDEALHYALDYDLWLRLGKRSAPVFIDAPQAAFRWYDTSKSGARFDVQFEEDLRVFERHAPPGDRLLRLEKRLHTAGIVAAYRVLRAFR